MAPVLSPTNTEDQPDQPGVRLYTVARATGITAGNEIIEEIICMTLNIFMVLK